MPRIAVLYYSYTGNVAQLARSVARGAIDAGADVRLRRVPEPSPDEEASDAARAARRAQEDVPNATLEDLRWCDGVAFGSPTRFGNMAGALKLFIDGAGELWRKGELVGKAASVFTSSSTQHGGQESTLLTMIVPLFHLGFVVMGLPYAEHRQSEMEYIQGGSPYGVSSVSGHGADRPPTENDVAMAISLGRRLAELAERLRADPQADRRHGGRAAVSTPSGSDRDRPGRAPHE